MKKEFYSSLVLRGVAVVVLTSLSLTAQAHDDEPVRVLPQPKDETILKDLEKGDISEAAALKLLMQKEPGAGDFSIQIRQKNPANYNSDELYPSISERVYIKAVLRNQDSPKKKIVSEIATDNGAPKPKSQPRSEIPTEDNGYFPWKDALEYQKPVADCNSKECFLKTIAAESKLAKSDMKRGLSSIEPELQKALFEKCEKSAYPQKLHCMANNLFLIKKQTQVALNSSKDEESVLRSVDYVTANFPNSPLMKAMNDTCEKVKANKKDCLVGALQQIGSDADPAMALLRDSYYGMAAIAVQSKLCEEGTSAVFESKRRKKHPELQAPMNPDWQGLGKGACLSKSLGAQMIAEGPFPYDANLAQMMGSKEAEKTDNEDLTPKTFNGNATLIKEVRREDIAPMGESIRSMDRAILNKSKNFK